MKHENGWIYNDAVRKSHFEAFQYETSRTVAQNIHNTFMEALAKALLASWGRQVSVIGIIWEKSPDGRSRHNDRWEPTSGPDGTMESLNFFRTQSILGIDTQAAVDKLTEHLKRDFRLYINDFHAVSPQEVQAYMPKKD